MSALPVLTDYAALFLQDIPLMDVRAPVEFKQGAFPSATNVPLLDDRQRELIGTEYKRAGQDAAIALGLQLATPTIREQRQQAWQNYIAAHPQGALYCFRGGLRSRTTQQWLAEQGIVYPLIKGGYKAMRRFLLETLEQACEHQPFICVSGRTGSGKTDLLQRLPHTIDLEALACHRGSTFGHTVFPQPSQIDFENALAIALLKHRHNYPGAPLFIEDESHLIGRIALPTLFQSALKRSPRIVLEDSNESREQRVVRDYIVGQRNAFAEQFAVEAKERFAAFVLGNLDRIKRRLGGVRHQQLRDEWSHALSEFETTGKVDGFLPGIRSLLADYYDPMYDYQFSLRDSPVICRGNADSLVMWASGQALHLSSMPSSRQ